MPNPVKRDAMPSGDKTPIKPGGRGTEHGGRCSWGAQSTPIPDKGKSPSTGFILGNCLALLAPCLGQRGSGHTRELSLLLREDSCAG